MERTTYFVPNADSPGRANIIKDGISRLPGVLHVGVDIQERQVAVEYDEKIAHIDDVYEQLIRLGFAPQGGRRAA